MALSSFSQQTEIAASSAEVKVFLADIGNYAKLHARPVQVSPLDEAPETTYLVRDRFRRLGVLVHDSYRLRVLGSADVDYATCVEQRPGIRITTVVVLAETATGGTAVTGRVSVNAPPLLQPWLYREARRTHQTMLASLKTLIETTRTTQPA